MKQLPRPPEDKSNVYLITHKGCMDGATCSLVFREWYDATLFPEDHVVEVTAGGMERWVKSSPLIDQDVFLIMADLGFTSPKYADVLEKRGNCVLLDHHRTSQHLADRSWCHVEMERCGSMLLADYLGASQGLQRFCEIVDDFDRGVFSMQESEDLATWNAYMGSDDFVKRFDDLAARAWMSTYPWKAAELPFLQAFNSRKNESINEVLRRVMVRKVVGQDGNEVDAAYVISCDPNISMILQRMLEHFPDCAFAVQINLDKKAVSLRSRHEGEGIQYDVAEFAKLYGGGGHLRAAGHSIDNSLYGKIVEEIHG